MASTADAFKLRAELRAHTADVRGVAVSTDGIIATASRDKTVALWNSQSLEPSLFLTGHDHFVNDLIFTNSGKLVTASADKTLKVWDAKNGQCITTMTGHTKSVCAVALMPSEHSENIISSSWDCTARVWDIQTGACIRVLSGHQAAVWSAAGLPDGTTITVAADKTVRMWTSSAANTSGAVIKTVHTDVVRDVVASPPGGFTTVANDSAIVFWSGSGDSFTDIKRVPDLHDGSYIYSVDSREKGEGRWSYVTGGEDNAVRLTEVNFASGEPEVTRVQTLVHPGTVWSACFCSNGDFVSACSDGVARVFTSDPGKVAEPDVLASFEKSVSERQLNTRVIGGVDVGKLPEASEALAVPGKKDGENKIVKTASGTAEVHMWSASEQKWTKVGEVVDGPGGGASLGAGDVKGKSYDFVFEVEIGEGGQNEKLGFNRGENLYAAAQRFIDDNELSQEFLEQIVQFIEQQVPVDALQTTAPGLSDPLTGGSRYVPRGGGQNASYSAGGDPLTGGSRYIPGSSSSGGGKLPPPRKLLPHRNGMILYKSTDQVGKIQQKLSEINTEMAKTKVDLALNMDEARVFADSLIPKLSARGGNAVLFEENECHIVEKLLKWPTKHIFPVLDIARLVVFVPSGGAYFFGKRNGAILEDVLSHLSSPEATGPVYIMGCRFLCNLFGNRVVGTIVRSDRDKILAATTKAANSTNRRARETYASLLINYAMMLHDDKSSASDRESLFSTSIGQISGGEQDEEVLYRLMLALGTLLCDDANSARKGVQLGAAEAAATAAPKSARLQQIALEIATIVAS